MNHSKTFHQLVDDIVHDYARYQRTDGGYRVNYNEISEFTLMELACALFKDDEYTSAISADNDRCFKSDILPAIWNALLDPVKPKSAIELRNVFQESILSYYEDTMAELINNACALRYGHLQQREYTSVDGRAYDVTNYV